MAAAFLVVAGLVFAYIASYFRTRGRNGKG
jgi:hypothetical protein